MKNFVNVLDNHKETTPVNFGEKFTHFVLPHNNHTKGSHYKEKLRS